LFGREAATLACALFAVWSFHLQLSTTAASEAVSLFFLLWGCAAFSRALETDEWGVAVASGLCLTLACAVRYDLWLLLPVMALVAARKWGFMRAAVWAVAAGAFPFLWLWGNSHFDGDPLAPVRQVEAFHRAWVAEELSRYRVFWGGWGEALYRGVQAAFWPGIAALTLGPWVALAMGLGLVRAWKRYPQSRWLTVVIAVPAVYFTFRSVALLNFVPLARFAVSQVALALPFAGVALGGRRAQALAGASAVVVAACLAAWTTTSTSRVAELLRPVSPVSRNPPPVRDAADFLRRHAAGSSDVVWLDADPAYWDVQLAFLSHMPDARLGRLRWREERAVPLPGEPTWLVTLPGGRWAQTSARQNGALLMIGDRRFEAHASFGNDSITLYRTVP
ncbi:MAG TPA: hypothetical protein VEY30_14035, partial [Myxococcaceae bacterium]|nr:hypothetical protein [Myxococcaceae bacterium]